MIQAMIVIVIVGVLVVWIWISPTLVRRRRERLKRRPFSSTWNAIVENALPIYTCLTTTEQKRLQGHIQVFLAEKQFIGCAGLQVTEDMKLAIAAVACLLLLNERENYFPNLRSILIYPSAYQVKETTTAGNLIVEERQVIRLGESWSRDQVVLAWKQVQQDMHNWRDGHNVILHEFAHQLDQVNGEAEGVPVLPQHADYGAWATVMSTEYQQLCRQVRQGTQTVINSYGATNPAEFFAVATETFFENPHQLLRQHPALYDLLHRYYRVDPVKWT